MKFFHWSKQCAQQIQDLEIKHKAALQGITINEKVADELRTQVMRLENENMKLKSQLLEREAVSTVDTLVYQAPNLETKIETPKKKK